MKTAFRFRLRLLRLRSSEIWVVGDTSRSRRTKPITKRGNMHCNWSILPLLLPTTTTWFSLDRKRWSHKRSRKKRKRSDSSDSDSSALMTPLTTPTLTLSLVKTNHRSKSIGSLALLRAARVRPAAPSLASPLESASPCFSLPFSVLRNCINFQIPGPLYRDWFYNNCSLYVF